MKSFKLVYLINAPLTKVWGALTNPKVISDWGAGPAKMSAKEGVEFSLWGGNIWGKNTKVVPNKLLVQDWYGGKWNKPSKVTFELKEKRGVTHVTLIHEDLPNEGWKDFYDGWKDYYLGPLKNLVE